MRRILVAAALALGAATPAALAVQVPTLPTVTTPTLSTPSVSVPTATVPKVTVPKTTVPTVTVPRVTTPVLTTPVVTTPPVTSPPVTTPRVTTPRVTTPQMTTPTATVPSTTVPRTSIAPRAHVPPPSAPTVAAPPAASASISPQPAASSTADASTAYPAGESSGRTARVHTSAARPHVQRFALARTARLVVTVWQQSPRCRLLGRYTLRAPRGVHVLHLPRRVGKHTVTTGTYRFVGLAAERKVLDVRIRVVRTHGKLHVRHTHLASVCTENIDTARVLAGIGVFGSAGAAGSAELGRPQTSGGHVAAGPFTPPSATPIPRPRPTLQIGSQTVSVQTLLFVLVGLAIALLAAGSVPGSAAGATPAAAIARHRAAVTSAGFALIVAAVLAALLT